MRGNAQALFGGEGLVFLGNQDPASYPTLPYPTLFVKKTLTGLYHVKSKKLFSFVAIDDE